MQTKIKVIWRAPRPCEACPTQPFNAVRMLKSKYGTGGESRLSV